MTGITFRSRLLDLRQQFETAHSGKIEIEQDDVRSGRPGVGALAPQIGQGRRAVGAHIDGCFPRRRQAAHERLLAPAGRRRGCVRLGEPLSAVDWLALTN